VPRSAATEPARDGVAAAASPFRRRWTWRTRVWVVLAGWLVAVVLRLLYRTLRVRIVDHGAFARREQGEQVLAVFWHDGIPLVPILVVRRRWPGRASVMLSWHRDAEIAAQAIHRLGLRPVRGSATRGRLGALRGLLDARARGEDIVIVPDGPRGPRHQAKEGVVQLARVTRLPVVVIGAAARPVRRLGSWDRMQLPPPFARVGLVMSPPLTLPDGKAEALAAIEAALARVGDQAAALVGGTAA
jgi:lysophospholipid acyltransferase (LPLAT)-like uncharacterized protein